MFAARGSITSKNIDFEIPHNSLTVVTGVSGSGKSSLAFDTVYAEGQRRYVESLSAYARQFLERIEKPDADLIDGIAPAVAIRQKNTTRNPRSTVATATEIYDYLRLLFARVGRTFCFTADEEVTKDTVDEVAAKILAHGRRHALACALSFADSAATAPVEAAKEKTRKKAATKAAVQDISDHLKSRLFELRKRGFNRLYQNGKIYEFSTPESLLEVNFAEPVFLLVDRLVVSPESRARIVDAIESGYRESGEVIFETAPRDGEAARRLRFSQRFECKHCTFALRRSGAASVLVQQSLRRMSALPRLREHDRFRHGVGDPGSSRRLCTRCHRAVDQTEIPALVYRAQAICASGRYSAGCSLGRIDADQQCKVIEGEGKFARGTRVLQSPGAKEVQACTCAYSSAVTADTRLAPNCDGARLRPEARQVRIDGKEHLPGHQHDGGTGRDSSLTR